MQVAECKCVTPGLTSALCPRFSPNGRLLLFMSHDAAAKSGVHCATAALHTLVWPPHSGVLLRLSHDETSLSTLKCL